MRKVKLRCIFGHKRKPIWTLRRESSWYWGLLPETRVWLWREKLVIPYGHSLWINVKTTPCKRCGKV